MLDFRHKTFLELCKIRNYTKTADAMHVTQPAVSQHIRFLEDYYKGKLFYYEGKNLMLTEHGKLLLNFTLTMSADCEKLRDILLLHNSAKTPLSFGATLTIGEYVMPKILAETMKAYPNLHITMSVDNTEVLLQKLRDGKIDFALLEGFFDKTKYGGALFSQEPFIPVCSKNSPLAGQTLGLSELLTQRIILREKGSGTRDIFEHLLFEHNLSIESFDKVCEIGNMSAIKQLVKTNLGISFLYKAAVEQELARGDLAEINIDCFPTQHGFHFVFLKDSLHQKEYMSWYAFLKNARENIDKHSFLKQTLV